MLGRNSDDAFLGHHARNCMHHLVIDCACAARTSLGIKQPRMNGDIDAETHRFVPVQDTLLTAWERSLSPKTFLGVN